MNRNEQLKQLRDMDTEALNEQADALKESLFRLKFRKSLGVGDVVADIRREKRTLARVYTILNERDAEKSNSPAEEEAQA